MGHGKIRSRMHAIDPRCHYCGLVTILGGRSKLKATLDHILPKSRGGRLTIENRLIACANCNGRKGSLAHDTFCIRPDCELRKYPWSKPKDA